MFRVLPELHIEYRRKAGIKPTGVAVLADARQ
jgi:hypothetical protein